MFKRVTAVFGLILSIAILLVDATFVSAQSDSAAGQSAPAAEPAKAADPQAPPAETQAKPTADQAEQATPKKPAAETAKPEVREPRLPSLPVPVTGNAVTVLRSHGTTLLFSMMGMGAKKTWDAVTNSAFYLDPDWDQWYPLKSIPGTAGRIDAAAVGARGNVFLFGGIVVDDHNRGAVVSDVNIYAPHSETWFRGTDMPVAVADSVAGVYRDRYIYLFGGRSNNGLTAEIQIYDAEKTQWLKSASLPGDPVFGHAGALLDDTIVLVDGAYKNVSPGGVPYLPSDRCWMGKIDRRDPTKIEWTKLAPHPGSARFGIGAGGSERDHKIYFSGGTDNPDGDTGIGFDGKPATPSPVTFAWNLRTAKWEVLSEATPSPAMNNRGLLVVPDGLALAGGIEKGQIVTRRVTLFPIAVKTR